MVRLRPLSVAAFILAILAPAALLAQPARTARVQVTVVDPSNAAVPEATVDLVGLEPASIVPTAHTSAAGVPC